MKKALLIISLFTIANIFAQEKKVKIYPFKSAIIEYKYEAQLSGTHVKYIDDYGYKQVDIIKKDINFGETKKKYETIYIVGNKVYTLNPLDTTIGYSINNTYSYYFKYKNKTGVEINEAIDANASGWKYTGNKQFLGKDCKIWESGKSIRYTWNSLILYEELNFMIMMVENATKIDIDTKIPEKIFSIPTGYKYSNGTGMQMGFSGLDLNFNKIKLVEKTKSTSEPTEGPTEEISEGNNITIEFNSDDYTNSQEFTFFDEKGSVVNVKGINDYKKFDNTIIQSQDFYLLKAEQSLPKYSTAFFKTPEAEYGKMQITNIDDNEFNYQYIIFSKEGFIKEYNKETNNGLAKFFEIKPDERNSKLLIKPLKESKILIIQ